MPATPPADRPLVVHVDVTDTVATHWRAGIQRVVVQLVAQLDQDPRIEVVPVAWLESVRGFRRLTGDETRRLSPTVEGPPAESPAGPSAGAAGHASGARQVLTEAWSGLRPLLGRVRRAVVAASAALRIEPALRRARRWALRRTRDRVLVPLRIELAPGTVLFEADTVWNNTWIGRDELYRDLAASGVHVAVLVYDLLPQQHPEWFEPSLVEVSNRTIAAQAEHADLVVAISAHTATALTTWAQARGLHPPVPEVIALGADAAGATSAPLVDLPEELAGVRYVLAVGTVEPRKNHTTLLDAFDRLLATGADTHLVVVGRPGWHNDDVLARLERHPELGHRLHWFRAAGDDLLATLYAHARVVAVTSLTEGYGLPVIEALAHGVPVVSSDGGALVEAGGDLVEHVGATDVDAWVEALGRHLVDDELDAARRDALATWVAPTWSATGAQVAGLLRERFAVR